MVTSRSRTCTSDKSPNCNTKFDYQRKIVDMLKYLFIYEQFREGVSSQSFITVSEFSATGKFKDVAFCVFFFFLLTMILSD